MDAESVKTVPQRGTIGTGLEQMDWSWGKSVKRSVQAETSCVHSGATSDTDGGHRVQMVRSRGKSAPCAETMTRGRVQMTRGRVQMTLRRVQVTLRRVQVVRRRDQVSHGCVQTGERSNPRANIQASVVASRVRLSAIPAVTDGGSAKCGGDASEVGAQRCWRTAQNVQSPC